MLLRTLLIKLTVDADLDGLDDANKGVDELGKESKKTGKELEGLEKDLDGVGDEAKQTARGADAAAKSIDKVGDEAKQTGREVGRLEGVFDKASSSLAGLGPALVAGGLAAAVVGAGEAIAFVTERTAELDAISKTAQKTGFSVEDIQIFTQVATLSGTEIGFLTKGITNLEIQLTALSKGGGGPAAEALDELGLTFDELKDKDPTEQLKIISTALEGIPDPTDKSRVAFGLMGEEGRELIPLFNSGADAIDKMVASTGKIFSPEDIAKAEAYQDALANLTKAWTDITGTLAIDAAPVLQSGVELLAEYIPAMREVGTEIIGKLAPAFERLFEAIAPLVEGEGDVLIDILRQLTIPLKTAADGVAFFANQLAFLVEIGTDVVNWVDGLLDRMQTEFPRAFGVAEQAITAILHPLDTARNVVIEIFDFIERAAGQIDGISSRVKSIRSTLGLSTDGTPTPAAATTSAQPGAGAAAEAIARRRDAEARARAGQEAQQLAAQAAATASSRRPRRRRGGGGGGGRGRGAAAPVESPLLAELGLTGPGTVMEARPVPSALTIVQSFTIKLIETLNIQIPPGTPPEQRAALQQAAGDARDAMVATLGDVTRLIQDASRTKGLAIQAGGGGGRSMPGVS